MLFTFDEIKRLLEENSYYYGFQQKTSHYRFYSPYILKTIYLQNIELNGKSSSMILNEGWYFKTKRYVSGDYKKSFLSYVLEWLKIFMPEEIAP